MPTNVKRLILAAIAFVAVSSAASAQVSHRLLSLVPHDEAAVCILVPDLRANAERLRDLPWVKRLEAAPFAQGLLRNNLHWAKVEDELKKHLQIEWSELRDEILGDAVVLADHPAGGQRDEQGLFLLHARNPARLASLVARINEGQKQTGELKDLVSRSHEGKQYYKRVEKLKSNFYYLDGGLLAFSGTEAWIKKVIEGPGDKPAALIDQFKQSEADKALASLWLNPRFIEKEFKEKAAGPESVLVRAVGSAWQAFEGIVVSAHADKDVELRLSLLARVKDMPPSVSKFFGEPSRHSELWKQLPADSIVAVAGRIDVPALATAAEAFLPRDAQTDALKKTLAAATGLDFHNDILPNLGPDWGFACWPTNSADFPEFAAAFAVRPGSKAIAVDKAILKAVHLAVSIAVFDFNLKNSTTIRLETDPQDVHYLVDAKLFPRGFRPAFGLKNGYLIFASGPEAIARFGKDPARDLPANETPLIRVSAAGFAGLLDQRREMIITHIAERNGIPVAQAREWFSQGRAILEHFQNIQLSHRAGDGQATWIFRIQPK